MRIRITMKDPDGVWESMNEQKLDLSELPEEVGEVLDQFFEYREYVTIELDTENKTARVCQGGEISQASSLACGLIDSLSENGVDQLLESLDEVCTMDSPDPKIVLLRDAMKERLRK